MKKGDIVVVEEAKSRETSLGIFVRALPKDYGVYKLSKRCFPSKKVLKKAH